MMLSNMNETKTGHFCFLKVVSKLLFRNDKITRFENDDNDTCSEWRS